MEAGICLQSSHSRARSTEAYDANLTQPCCCQSNRAVLGCVRGVPVSCLSRCMVGAGWQIGARGVAQVTHHENSRVHWSELPARFLDALPAHDRAHGTHPPALMLAPLTAACS